MTRPELWVLLDGIARRNVLGGSPRLTNAELVDWLNDVATRKTASRFDRRDAKKAARLVPKLIGPVFELAAYVPPPKQDKPAQVMTVRPASYTPSLFDESPEEQTCH